MPLFSISQPTVRSSLRSKWTESFPPSPQLILSAFVVPG